MRIKLDAALSCRALGTKPCGTGTDCAELCGAFHAAGDLQVEEFRLSITSESRDCVSVALLSGSTFSVETLTRALRDVLSRHLPACF